MMVLIDKEEANVASDPYHTLRTIRFLSLILIALGLLFSLYWTVFIFGYSRPQGLIEVVVLLLPYLYLFSFFLCCLRSIRGRVLVGLCVIFNLPVIIFIGYALANLSFIGVVLALFPTMWILLCRERLKVEGATPANGSLSRSPR